MLRPRAQAIEIAHTIADRATPLGVRATLASAQLAAFSRPRRSSDCNPKWLGCSQLRTPPRRGYFVGVHARSVQGRSHGPTQASRLRNVVDCEPTHLPTRTFATAVRTQLRDPAGCCWLGAKTSRQVRRASITLRL